MTQLTGPIHTWTLSRKSLLMRYYLQLYETPPRTFCQLWWGMFVSPLVALFLLIIFPFVAVAHFIQDRPSKTQPAAHEETYEELVARLNAEFAAEDALKAKKAARKAKRAERAAAIRDFFANSVDHVVAWFQAHKKFTKVISTSFVVLFWVVAGGISFGAAGYGIYSAVAHSGGFFTGLKWGGIGLVGIVVVALIFALFYIALIRVANLGTFGVVGRFFIALGKLIGRSFMGIILDFMYGHILLPIGRFFWTVGLFIKAGDHAIKYRTCPMIKIED